MTKQNGQFYEFDGFRIRADERLLTHGTRTVNLPPKAIDLLLVLLAHHGRVVSKEDLMTRVWSDTVVEEANLSHNIFLLRKALGAGGEYIETVSKRGYRFVGDVDASPGDAGPVLVSEQTLTRISLEEEIETNDPAGAASAQLSRAPERGSASSLKLGAAIAFLILIAAVSGYWYAAREADSEQLNAIAVMPFVNETGNADVEYLSDGMTETLISTLAQVPKLSVKARSSVFRYKGKEVSTKTVGSDLNVRAVLNGRLVQRGDELTLFLSLVDAETENQIWGKQYNRKLNNLVALQTEIARDVSASLKTKLTGADEQRLAKKHTENAEAYRQYLLGNFYWKKFTADGMKKAINCYEKAIELDQNYALAYSGLANSYSVLGVNGHMPVREAEPHVRVAAEKAVALDDELAEAHLSLGAYKMFFQWDLSGAEAAYKRSMELDPAYPTAPELYSYVLQAQKRFDEAIVQAKKACELDPLTLITTENLSTIYRHAGRLNESLAVLENMIEMDPSFADAHFERGLSLSLLGRHDDAEKAARRGIELSDQSTHIVTGLGIVYARAGKRQEALNVINGLVKNSTSRYVSPLDIALIYSVLGDADNAFEWLERAYAERSGWLFELNVNPDWDPIRSNSRFQDLIGRVGLAH